MTYVVCALIIFVGFELGRAPSVRLRIVRRNEVVSSTALARALRGRR